MATKMEKLARESSKKPQGKRLKIDAHFEALKEEVASEVIDILASMICDYLGRNENNE